MPVGLGLAAAGTVAGAAVSASGAKSAAKTEANAANQAAGVQKDMFNVTRGDLAPYRDLGSTVTPAYLKLLGLNPDGSVITSNAPIEGQANTDAWLKANPDVETYYNQTPEAQTVSLADFAKQTQQQQSSIRSAMPTYTSSDVANYRNPTSQFLENLPGYQFEKQQGVNEAARALGSRGLTGAQAKGISRFVTGLADKSYGDTVTRLSSAVTTGANAALGTGQISQNVANSIGGNIVGAGQASAAGTVGAANAASGALTSISQLPLAAKYMGIYGGGK